MKGKGVGEGREWKGLGKSKEEKKGKGGVGKKNPRRTSQVCDWEEIQPSTTPSSSWLHHRLTGTQKVHLLHTPHHRRGKDALTPADALGTRVFSGSQPGSADQARPVPGAPTRPFCSLHYLKIAYQVRSKPTREVAAFCPSPSSFCSLLPTP